MKNTELTLLEWLIIACIIGIIAAIVLGKNAVAVEDRCMAKGYILAPTSHGRGTLYCTKVQGGNTIVIHVDSLR